MEDRKRRAKVTKTQETVEKIGRRDSWRARRTVDGTGGRRTGKGKEWKPGMKTRTYGHKTTRRKNGARRDDGRSGTLAGKSKCTNKEGFPPHYEPTGGRAEVAKTRGQGGRQDEARESDKETRNRREDRTSGILVGREKHGWNREVEIGDGRGMKATDEEADVLGSGKKGDELQNRGGGGEQIRLKSLGP